MAVTNELIGAGMPALQASLLGDGNYVRSTYNGVGVVPASATTGFEITSNYNGFGEVDFWNLAANNSLNQQGFFYWQKNANGTATLLSRTYSSGAFTEFDLISQVDGGHFLSMYVDALESGIYSVGNKPLNFYVNTSTLALTLTSAGRFIVPVSVTPSAANAAGVAGTIAWDTNFIYVCVTTNTWKRVAIATW